MTELYTCGVNFTAEECWGHSLELNCCPPGAYCSAWGCSVNATQGHMFVSTTKLIWINASIQLLIIFAGIFDFILATVYYRLRRRRMNQRVERSHENNTVVNEEMSATDATSKKRKRLVAVSELNGRCCGCGGGADTVLLPCKHAVCCFSCSRVASFCPYCKAECTSKQRLFPV